MPANWVFLAVPLAALVIVYAIYSAVKSHQEQTYLRAVYDGDRLQQWKSDRRNARHNRPAANTGRHFY